MIEKVEVKASGRTVISSGIVFTFDRNGEIELRLKTSGEEYLSVLFKFEDDNSREMRIEYKFTKYTLIIKCINFHNEFGTGVERAFEIGDYEGKKLYLTFMVYEMKERKKLEYNFFMEGVYD